MFTNHQFVSIDGTFYDPSYGAIYSSLLDFDDNYLSGYWLEEPKNLNEMTVGIDLNKDGTITDIDVTVAGILCRKNLIGTREVWASFSSHD